MLDHWRFTKNTDTYTDSGVSKNVIREGPMSDPVIVIGGIMGKGLETGFPGNEVLDVIPVKFLTIDMLVHEF